MRINATFTACGEWSAAARLAAVVGETTGVFPDHLVAVNMSGFIALVDKVGGWPVTLEFPLRDVDARLDLAEGRHVLSGEEALSLMRSRKAKELRGGVWRSIPGGDLARAGRQRELLRFLGSKLLEDRSPASVLESYRLLAPHLAVSSGLSTQVLVELAQLAPDPDEFVSVAPPVRSGRLGAASVVYATEDLATWTHSQLYGDSSSSGG